MELASVEKKVEMIDTWEEEERIATERRSLCQIQCQKPNDRGLAKRWLWPVVELKCLFLPRNELSPAVDLVLFNGPCMAGNGNMALF